MPRRPRVDSPGRLHHVVNRGVRRRPLFELPSDRRRFEALIACAARAERIRVHASCLLSTHFHLLLESVDGKISATMQWIQSRYAAHFNRTRDLDGRLVGSRFFSAPVTSRAYLFLVIRYIDSNPVNAGLCDDPLAYPFGSARRHARAAPPRWLARDRIESLLGLDRRGRTPADRYRRVFHASRLSDASADLVEARLAHPSRARDDLDAFLCTNGAGRRAWIVRRAREADGTSPGLPMADAGSVRKAIAVRRAGDPSAELPSEHGRRCNLWDVAEVGLLRDLAGQSFTAIGDDSGRAPTTVRRRYALHRKAIEHDAGYLAILGEVAHAALERCFGPAGRAVAAEIVEGRVAPMEATVAKAR